MAPQWSHLTDFYAAANADALSWVIILAMMLSGLVLTIEFKQEGEDELRRLAREGDRRPKTGGSNVGAHDCVDHQVDLERLVANLASVPNHGLAVGNCAVALESQRLNVAVSVGREGETAK